MFKEYSICCVEWYGVQIAIDKNLQARRHTENFDRLFDMSTLNSHFIKSIIQTKPKFGSFYYQFNQSFGCASVEFGLVMVDFGYLRANQIFC